MHSEFHTFDSQLKCPCCGEKVGGEVERVDDLYDSWIIKLSCYNCGIWVIKKNVSALAAHAQATKKFVKIANKKARKKNKGFR